jgi:hypothetical protein
MRLVEVGTLVAPVLHQASSEQGSLFLITAPLRTLNRVALSLRFPIDRFRQIFSINPVVMSFLSI